MKIRVKIGDLVEQITQTAITIDRKAGDMPSGKIFLQAKSQVSKEDETVKKHYLYLFSTNQANKTFIKMPIENILEEGMILIDPDRLLGGLVGRDQTEFLDLEVLPAEGKIRIKVGRNVMNLPLNLTVETAAATIKSLPRGNAIAKISASSFISFIKRSSFCIPLQDNGQQSFAMGVLNLHGQDGSYFAQATDGSIVVWHKSAQTDTTKFNLVNMLIPVDTLNPLLKLLQCHRDTDIEILEGTKDPKGNLQEVFFKMEGVLFGSVLRAGTSPNIEMILEQHKPTFIVQIEREGLKSALIRAANFVESGADKRGIKLSPTVEGTLKIDTANTVADLTDELDAEATTGVIKPLTSLFNLDYLSNITASQSSEKIAIGFNVDRGKAITMTDDSDSSLVTRYAVMPILPDKKPIKTGKAKAKVE